MMINLIKCLKISGPENTPNLGPVNTNLGTVFNTYQIVLNCKL